MKTLEAKTKAKEFESSSGSGNINSMLIIRLAAASVLFAVSLILKLPPFVKTLLLIASAVSAGYDIVLSAINFVVSGDFFSTPMVVTFVAFLAFVIGFPIEAAALTILYQIGILIIEYTEERIRKNALDMLRYEKKDASSDMASMIENSDYTCMSIEQSMGYNSGLILKIAMLIALVYAIVMPLVSNMTYQVSIHRCLMIFLVSTPMSVVVAMPSVAAMGLCRCAQFGVNYRTAADMERAGSVSIAIFDKAGVIDNGSPRLTEIQADLIDKRTFMDFAAHAVYYSEQPFAYAFSAVYKKDYQLDLIADFNDIPGYGVELKIKGLDVIFGKKELFRQRGVNVPEISDENAQPYFMSVAGKLVGWILIVNEVNPEIKNIIASMKDAGLDRCILITEDGKEETVDLADELMFDDAYSGFDTEKKLAFVEHIKHKEHRPVVFIYSSGIECHSKADVDIRVGSKTKFADATVKDEFVCNLPAALSVSGRVKEIATENAVFAFVVKVILIFLSITGFCNIWFAVFIDMAACIATLLNASRVTSDSLIGTLLYKMGR